MKKIIIFGATGNVGSYVHKYACDYFKDRYEVIASGHRQTDFFEKQGQKYVSVDISRAEEFDKLPQEDVYAVIDLAAQIPSYMKGYQPEKYVQSNIMGAYNVLEYCRKVHADRILFSTTVFDISLSATNGAVLKPDMPYNFSYKGDHAVYVITKNTAIEFMKHYYAEYGLKYFVFRFPTIYNYSPYHYYHPNGVKTLRPVYRMIDQAMKGEPIELWGDPSYSKDMCQHRGHFKIDRSRLRLTVVTGHQQLPSCLVGVLDIRQCLAEGGFYRVDFCNRHHTPPQIKKPYVKSTFT